MGLKVIKKFPKRVADSVKQYGKPYKSLNDLKFFLRINTTNATLILYKLVK